MIRIEQWCRHCGEQLSAEWAHDGGPFVIDGAYPVLVVHSRTGNKFCTITRTVSFDVWDVNKALQKVDPRGRCL